jgi:ribosome-binding protein aMBF1 (putative translation factor)
MMRVTTGAQLDALSMAGQISRGLSRCTRRSNFQRITHLVREAFVAPRRTEERTSMLEEDVETNQQRRREVRAIKKIVRPDQRGRGAYLPGLWACRLASGYSQQELAERAETGRTTIRSLERKERRAHATTIRRLSRALGVSPAELLTAEATEEE